MSRKLLDSIYDHGVKVAMQISLNVFIWLVKSTFLDASGSYLGQWLSMVF